MGANAINHLATTIPLEAVKAGASTRRSPSSARTCLTVPVRDITYNRGSRQFCLRVSPVGPLPSDFAVTVLSQVIGPVPAMAAGLYLPVAPCPVRGA